MGSDGIARLERALEHTFRRGSCRFRAVLGGAPMHGEIDLDAGVARSQVEVSHAVPHATPEQVHRGRTVYQPVDDGDAGTWLAMPVGTGGSDPTGMLDLLRGAVSADPSHGDAGGRLNVEVDVSLASARVDDASAFRSWVEEIGLPDRMTLTVDIEEPGGGVRRVHGVLPAVADGHEPLAIEVAYEDLGVPVDIVIPAQDRLV